MLSFGFHRSPLLCAFVRLCILCPVFGLCWYLWPFACFCKNLMFNISFGCCRHSVSNTFVQLTEGHSARDQPKQPPAKKSLFDLFGLFGLFGFVWFACLFWSAAEDAQAAHRQPKRTFRVQLLAFLKAGSARIHFAAGIFSSMLRVFQPTV